MRPRLPFSRHLTPALAAVAAIVACGCGSSAGHTAAAGHGAAPPVRTVAALRAPENPVPRTVRVPILTYHRVHVFATELTKSVPDLTVEPDEFAAQMSALASAGYHTITQRQLFDALYSGAALPTKPVLVSVDDGYVDDVAQVLPVLQRLHMVATFYVITGRFSEPGFLNQSQVRTLDQAGMDVGAHTRHHVPLPELSGAALDSEVAGSRSDLEAILGHPVYWFAYPFGEYSVAVVDAVRRAGFLLAATTDSGSVESTRAPLEMPRLHVGRAETVAGVLSFAAGTGATGTAGGE